MNYLYAKNNKIEFAENEQKKKSVLKKLQEAPTPEPPKPARGCVLCGELERI